MSAMNTEIEIEGDDELIDLGEVSAETEGSGQNVLESPNATIFFN